jgi:hypothetical protein
VGKDVKRHSSQSVGITAYFCVTQVSILILQILVDVVYFLVTVVEIPWF